MVYLRNSFLFKNTVIPAQCPGPVQNRQVPRAPLPASGVTIGGRVSRTLSGSVTRRSSLLRTDPPVRSPSTASVFNPCAVGPGRLLSAPAGKRTFPTLSPQSLSSRLDPYPAVFLRCMTRFFPKDSGLAIGTTSLAHRTISAKQLPQRGIFRGCIHSLMFRLLDSLDPPVAPTARPRRSWAAGPFTPRQAPDSYLPGQWHRYVPESGNWHGGTCTRWIAALSAAHVPLTPTPLPRSGGEGLG